MYHALRAISIGAAVAPPPADARVAEWEADGIRQRAVIARGALVSGLDDGSGMRLLTIIPVAGDPASMLAQDEPRLRWNAALRP